MRQTLDCRRLSLWGANIGDHMKSRCAVQDHLLMEVSFPGDYPHAPFFLRMVTPRCVWCAAPTHAHGASVMQLHLLKGNFSVFPARQPVPAHCSCCACLRPAAALGSAGGPATCQCPSSLTVYSAEVLPFPLLQVHGARDGGRLGVHRDADQQRDAQLLAARHVRGVRHEHRHPEHVRRPVLVFQTSPNIRLVLQRVLVLPGLAEQQGRAPSLAHGVCVACCQFHIYLRRVLSIATSHLLHLCLRLAIC